MPLRRLVVPLMLALAAVAPLAWPASRATVGCDSVVQPVGPVTWRPKRVVLGVVAVPPAYVGRSQETGDRRWPYWTKAGLVVRAGSPPVVVSVPAAWRDRVAIGWGRVQATTRLRIEPCPPLGLPGGWNPYAGGFRLPVRAACLPLSFTVDGSGATVRFGIDKRCP